MWPAQQTTGSRRGIRGHVCPCPVRTCPEGHLLSQVVSRDFIVSVAISVTSNDKRPPPCTRWYIRNSTIVKTSASQGEKFLSSSGWKLSGEGQGVTSSLWLHHSSAPGRAEAIVTGPLVINALPDWSGDVPFSILSFAPVKWDYILSSSWCGTLKRFGKLSYEKFWKALEYRIQRVEAPRPGPHGLTFCMCALVKADILYFPRRITHFVLGLSA